jgi:hypothetical protein
MTALVDQLRDACLVCPTAEAAVNHIKEQVLLWKHQTLPPTSPPRGPVWQGLEQKTWDAGEALRQVLQRRKRWRSDVVVDDFVAWVLSQGDLAKGRQPFVELCGGLRGPHDATLVSFLRDPDLRGQAIKALRARHAFAHGDAVREVVEVDKRGWVRREGKKYLKACEAASQ